MPNNQGGWVWLNSQGRAAGKGTTSKARQEKRKAAKEKERWESGELSAYQKRQLQAQEGAEQTRAHRTVSIPAARSAREFTKASASDSSWMPAGKHGKRQCLDPTPAQSLQKDSNPLKKGRHPKLPEQPAAAESLKKDTKTLEKATEKKGMESFEEIKIEELPPWEEFQAVYDKQQERLDMLKKKLTQQKEKARQPLEKGPESLQKGTPAKSEQSSLQSLQKGIPEKAASSSSKPLQKGSPLCKKVAIDWRGTMANDDNVVKPSTLAAIEKLLAAGCEVYILSYCFAKRQAEVRGHAEALPIWDKLAGCLFTTCKTGPKGKASLCKKVGIEALFDDNAAIMMECWEESVWPFPIKTFHSHSPLEKGSLKFVQPKDTLEEAIDLFLSPDCRFHDWIEL